MKALAVTKPADATPDLTYISPENLARLQAELEHIETHRAAYKRRLIGGYMSALFLVPVAIVGFAIAGKYGLLVLLKPLWAPVAKWLAALPWPTSYRSRKLLNKLIVQAVFVTVIAPITYCQWRLKKRNDLKVLPLVFQELHIPYHQPGTLPYQKYDKHFNRKPDIHENPLSVDGVVPDPAGDIPFSAHLIKWMYLKHDFLGSTPTKMPLFEGVLVEMILPLPSPVTLRLTFEKTRLSSDGLEPVKLPTPELENAFSAYADDPQAAKDFLSPDFLADLLLNHNTTTDLPPLEIVLEGHVMSLLIPAKQQDWLAHCRLNTGADHLQGIKTMLRSWRMLSFHLTLMRRYHPELFKR